MSCYQHLHCCWRLQVSRSQQLNPPQQSVLIIGTLCVGPLRLTTVVSRGALQSTCVHPEPIRTTFTNVHNMGSSFPRATSGGMILDRSGIDSDPGSIWDRSGIDPVSIQDRTQIDPGSVRDRSRSGIGLGSIRDRSRIVGVHPRPITRPARLHASSH